MPEPTTSAPQAQSALPYAGFWVRFLAVLIDSIILGVVTGPLYYLGLNNPTSANVFNPLAYLIGIAYSVLLVGYKGATLGKMAMGLQIVRVDGSPVGLGKAALREIIGKLASSIVFGLGFLWVAFDPKKQGWHDKIAGTVVVRK